MRRVPGREVGRSGSGEEAWLLEREREREREREGERERKRQSWSERERELLKKKERSKRRGKGSEKLWVIKRKRRGTMIFFSYSGRCETMKSGRRIGRGAR